MSFTLEDLDKRIAARAMRRTAIWTDEIDRSAIAWTPILVDDLHVMARRGHPLVRQPPASLRDLEPFGWVLSGMGNPTRRRLAAVYEHARYTDGADLLGDAEREQARRALVQLAEAL